MTRKDPKIALGDILTSIDRILDHTESFTAEDFIDSVLVQDAVLRRLAIIGEAVKLVPDSIRQANPEIPWRRIAGMRDILVHDYSEVDLELTWAVVVSELPGLRLRLEKLLDELD
jgi:uncharacterized protein with HEPN domain